MIDTKKNSGASALSKDELKNVVGGYVLGKLWEELQLCTQDERGFIVFDFERFKRIHDIAPGAKAST
jgi:hypothetical protein